MKKEICFLLSFILIACTAPKDTDTVMMVERLSTPHQNIYYVSNQDHLQFQQFIKLSAGSIESQGWLKKQDEFQKDGLNGPLAEVGVRLQKDDARLANGGKYHTGNKNLPAWVEKIWRNTAVNIINDQIKLGCLWGNIRS